jgi:hypothetical protein
MAGEIVMADQRIDFSRSTGGPEPEDVNRHRNPQRETRPQAEKERAPDTHQRTAEKEGRSEWSGAWAGGRSR